ncbi:sulfide quinone reductase-like protein [Emiliania huxleyi CCMP1516]|uniref:Sulfide:quinone oxidoreductase, mitochondrial n=2 Tax=Emiliania huxleyi TaxID=2903 RepID=A0A0D3J8W3_EMIH1|nr:sulfide quinone reductase-like protein [Emiliania huxleyi CCMP1516]EOD19948.1 sulfide quinone reductase-like protein [Emiliania huxleyi CCMP1516]|eukprot:XP_005772377.1 sulfide quinone reductase-like protein [Emiliania huxleyi CCMP1516]
MRMLANLRNVSRASSVSAHFRRHASTGTRKHKIVVVGGGAGGLSSAAMLLRKGGLSADVAVVEPSSSHFYQPLWTLVGGGIKEAEESRRDMASVMPKDATWIQSAAKTIDPDEQAVILESGDKVFYDYLLVAAGIKVNFDSIAGLKETIGKNGVSSIYDFNYCTDAWKDVEALKSGTALFTMPSTAVKCGGAPQKIMWVAEDYWRHQAKVRDNIHIEFMAGTGAIFAVPKYAAALEGIRKERGVETSFKHELIKVDGPNKVATFQTDEGPVERSYDLLHVVPLMGAHDWIKGSKIADPDTGYVTVDKDTLQHTAYPNVFAIGDCSNTPNSKTAAAAPVVVHNMRRVMAGKAPNATYDGYASCPIVTGRGKLILAEFKYGNELAESQSWYLDQGKEQLPFFYLKKYVFPNFMLPGRWYGTRTIFEPSFPDPA